MGAVLAAVENEIDGPVNIGTGRGFSMDDVASMAMVAEGVPTTTSAHACAHRLGVETPIIDEIHAVLSSQKSPAQAMKAHMSRELRSEEI